MLWLLDIIIQSVRVGNQGRWRLEVVIHKNIIMSLVSAFKDFKAFKNLWAIMKKVGIICQFYNRKGLCSLQLGAKNIWMYQYRHGHHPNLSSKIKCCALLNERVCFCIRAHISSKEWEKWRTVQMVSLKWFMLLLWQPKYKSIFKRSLICHVGHMCCLFGHQQLNV